MGDAELVGLLAGLLTTAAYVPQVAKTLRTGSARDFSLPTLLMLVIGVGLWLVCGVLEGSVALVAANAVTLVLASAILVVKLRHG